jgi:hypothetical protein
MSTPKVKLVHLRVWWGTKATLRDCARNGRGHSACDRAVKYEYTAAMGRRLITCPDCAVFADAWRDAGKTGRITIRKARAFAANMAERVRRVEGKSTTDDIERVDRDGES